MAGGLFSDIQQSIFGPDEADRISANKVKEQADVQQALHQFNPALPDASTTSPTHQSSVLSDLTFGVFGQNNSNLIKAHSQEVQQLAQAKDQGRMDYNQLLTRVSAITSKYSSMDPTNASTYQAVGSKIIGFNPTEKILSDTDTEQKRQDAVKQSLDQIYLEAGAKTGSVPIDPATGDVDEAKLRIAGQDALSADDKFKQWQQDKKTNQAPLPEWQAVADETSKARSVLAPVLNNFLDTGRKNLEVAMMAHPEWSDNDRQEAVSASLANAEQQYEMTLSDFAAKNGVSPQAFKNLREENSDFWQSTIKPLTGDLSSYKTMQRSFDTLDTKLGIGMLQAAPHIAAATKAFGPSAAGAMVGPMIDASPSSTGIKAGIAQDIQNLGNPMQPMQHATELGTGGRSIDQMTGKEQQAAIPVLLKGLNTQAENVKDLDSAHVTTFGTGLAQLLQYSDKLTSASDLTNAATQLNNPNMTAALKKLEAQNPQGAALVGDKLRDLTTRAFLSSAASHQSDAGQGVAASIEFDPSSNKFSSVFEKDGKRLPLAAGQFEQKYINNLNSMAAGVVATKDYGGARISRLDASEISQALADVAGIRSKQGVLRTPYDPDDVSGLPIGITGSTQPASAPGPAVQSPPNAPGTTTMSTSDIKDNLVALGTKAGLPPNLALAVGSHETGGTFDPASKSPLDAQGKYAYGVMQLREDTANDLGVDRFDVNDNMRGGVDLLAQHYAKFGGDIDKTLAAYYKGPNSPEVQSGQYSQDTQNYIDDVKRRLKTLDRKDKAKGAS